MQDGAGRGTIRESSRIEMSFSQLRLAPGGGYFVDLSTAERWWVQPNVEPFRSASRSLGHESSLPNAWTRSGPFVPLKEREELLRENLCELQNLGMAWRIP